MKISITALVLGMSLSTAALAAVGPTIVLCKVNGFDEKTAKLKCDPTSKDVTMVTPREWLDPEVKMKSGAMVKLSLDEKQYAAWMAMNKGKK